MSVPVTPPKASSSRSSPSGSKPPYPFSAGDIIKPKSNETFLINDFTIKQNNGSKTTGDFSFMYGLVVQPSPEDIDSEIVRFHPLREATIQPRRLRGTGQTLCIPLEDEIEFEVNNLQLVKGDELKTIKLLTAAAYDGGRRSHRNHKRRSTHRNRRRTATHRRTSKNRRR
jgi:hypothetical protein